MIAVKAEVCCSFSRTMHTSFLTELTKDGLIKDILVSLRCLRGENKIDTTQIKQNKSIDSPLPQADLVSSRLLHRKMNL